MATNRLDGQEGAFANAGTTRAHGRAQRMQDRATGVDQMVQEQKIPRPRIRRKRPGAFRIGSKPLPPVPGQ